MSAVEPRDARVAYVTAQVENECDGCVADGDVWTPAEACPVHGVDAAAWWLELNRQLDERWPRVPA